MLATRFGILARRYRSWIARAPVLAMVACGGGDGGGGGNDFHPSGNTTISGSVTYDEVNIPAGVTVTVSADAVITVSGDFTQAGTVLAPCHALTLLVDGAVAITGNVDNKCATPTGSPPDLRIVGKTSYSVSGGTISTSGDLSVVNDPTDGINGLPTSPPRLRAADRTIAAVTVGRCVFENETIDIADAPDGTAANPNGGHGPNAFLGCGFLFSGNTGGTVKMNNVTVNGSNGGDGIDDTKTDATATGGNGSPPGSVFVSADENIELNGTITINAGDGGKGGNATSTGSNGNPGKDATAIAGHGAGLDPGGDPVRFEAGGSISQAGALAVHIGTAGNGGTATATGGNGDPGNPGAPGGKSTGTGGNGGNGMNVRMHATGAVTLNGSVTIDGGAAGDAGVARCLGGNGGAGNAPAAAGGPAGLKTCRGGVGGQGGAASLRVSEDVWANLTPGTPGGDAGAAEFSGGRGGDGAPNCPTGPGGAGGKGSDIVGGDGNRGTGTPNGSGANASVTNSANGGDGAAPGGAAGAAGGNGLTHGIGGTGGFNIVNSFNPGLPGGVCPPQISFISATPNTPTIVQGGSGTVNVGIGRTNYTNNVLVELKDVGSTTRGSTTISGPAGTSGSFGFTVPAGEPTGTRNWTLVASGTGVTTVTVPYPINVTAAASPDFSLVLSPTSDTKDRGATGTVRATGTRTGGFTGQIDLVLKKGDGSTLATGAITAGNSFFDIFYTVPLTEPLGLNNWSVTGSGTGVPTHVSPFPMTVNTPARVDVDLNTMPHNGNLVPFGTHTLNLTVGGTQRGSIQISTVFNSGNHFWSMSAPAGLRVGSGDGNGFRFLLNTAQVDGSSYTINGVGYCLRNGTGLDTGHPVVINQRNSGGSVIGSESVTSLPNGNAGPQCQWSTILPNATSIEILAPMGAGRFIDSGTWQLWRPGVP